MPISISQNKRLEDQIQAQNKLSSSSDTAYFLDNFTRVTERVSKLESMVISSDEICHLERALLDENSKEDLVVNDGRDQASTTMTDFISVLEHHKRQILATY